MQRHRVLLAFTLAVVLGMLIAIQVWAQDAGNGSTADPTSQPAALAQANCRYGVATVYEATNSQYWVPTLGAGWVANFSIYDPELTNSEFVFTVRVRQDQLNGVRLNSYTFPIPLTDWYLDENGNTQPGLSFFVKRAKPGSIWMIGNEIEIDNLKQDNLMPQVYARAYRDAYNYIKNIDPTARLAIGAVTMGTPGRLQYLDIVWNTYRQLYGTNMPVDVWNAHIYILPERTKRLEPQYADGKIALGTDPNLAIKSTDIPAECPAPGLPDTPENDPRHDIYCTSEHDSVRIYREQIYNLRRWMKAHDEQDRPLIISEFGSLFPYRGVDSDGSCENRQDIFGNCMTPERVTRFLRGAVDFMEDTKDSSIGYPRDDYRLVQRWLWYSVHTPFQVGESSNLLLDNYLSFPTASMDALAMIGKAFREEAFAHGSLNLQATGASSSTVIVDKPTSKGTGTVSVSYRNAGTLSITQPFTITFYRDPELTSRIGSVVVAPQSGPMMGCTWASGTLTAQVSWPSLAVGLHPYWARIDSGNVVPEGTESDNIAKGMIEVKSSITGDTFTTYLPVARGD